jgi:hypothetical protein
MSDFDKVPEIIDDILLRVIKKKASEKRANRTEILNWLFCPDTGILKRFYLHREDRERFIASPHWAEMRQIIDDLPEESQDPRDVYVAIRDAARKDEETRDRDERVLLSKIVVSGCIVSGCVVAVIVAAWAFFWLA